jgi:hypothetical protein
VRRRADAQLVPKVLILALFSFGISEIANAQYFGRNKVQWEKFDWRVLKTEHFDVHYYPAEEQAVRDAARMAERWYTRLSGIFGYQLSERKPLILYADPSDFQQTTVIGGLIGEGTGGVTEPVRTRVIMPLAGTYEDTDHVLGHELVHVFQFETLLGRREETPRQTQVNMPLWFIEGLAEYLSLGRESPLTAMWLRDAVLRDDLPDLKKLSRSSRYFPYRWGQAFWAYVGGRWGDEATTRLFVTASQAGLEPAMQEVLGLKEEEFSNQWRAAIRAAYQPVLDRRQPPKLVGGRILPRGEGTRLETYVSPSVSPDGSQVIFLSTRSLFSFDLYLADAATGEVRGKLVSADSDPHFDALSFLESAGGWSPDGRKFAFVVYSKGDNELAVLDVGSRKVERRIGLAGVGALWNPSWSPDGRSIVVSGAAGGVTDLYLVDVESGRTRKLTDDVYSDLQPTWSPDGKTIAFASDRGPGTDVAQLAFGRMGLWLLDVASGQVREVPVAAGREPGERFNPQFGPGGTDLYFLEARGGINDIFRLSLASGELFQVTDVATGVSGITRTSPALSVAQGNGRVVFSLFNDTEYALHSLDRAQAQGKPVAGTTELRAGILPPAEPRTPSAVAAYLKQPEPVPATGAFPSQDYRAGLKLDYLAPTAGVAVSSFGYAVGGDVTAVWSDMLNEHLFGFTLVGSSGGSLNELGAQAIYLNQAQRWNWGVQGGHVPFISAFTTVRPVEVETGDGGSVIGREIQQIRQTVTLDQVGLVTQYPFSATRRFETTAGITRLGYDNELFSVVVVGDQVIDRSDRDLPSPQALSLYQGSVALVGDNSYFGYTSPVRGQRYRLEVEPTFGDLQFQSLRLDYRRYFFARPVTFAFRGLHLGRFGRDAEDEQLAPLFLGEETLVRGYAIGSLSGSECTPVPGDPNACPEFDRLIGSRIGVANFEVRFPLTGVEGFGLIKAPAVPIELAAFVDAGTAWTKDTSPDLAFRERTIERVPVVSAGVSARLLLGGFAVLHFYYAKPFQRPDEGAVTGFFIAPGW